MEAIIKAITLLARELTASTDENEMNAFSNKMDGTSVNDGSREISIAYEQFQDDSSEALARAMALEE